MENRISERKSRGEGNAMKKMKRLGFALVALSLNAHAEFKDGNELLSNMNSIHVEDRMAALGYVMGVADVGWGFIFCAPGTVQAGQIRDMVKNYLTNTPAERHLTADILVSRTLKLAWPCKKGNPT